MNKQIWSIILSTILLAISNSPVYAITIPSFPACANPQGATKVSYSEGTHGIVGSGATYTGKDAVYTLTADTLTQCFCPTEGQGIQTNWWKADQISESDIDVLKSQGWYYVPAGQLWGLADSPYVAKNSNYSCLSGSSQILGTGIGGGDETGEILGLAATGDSVLVYSSFLIGSGLLYIGIKRIRQNG